MKNDKLYKALCMLLPYGVKCMVYGQTEWENEIRPLKSINKDGDIHIDHESFSCDVEKGFKVCLFPLSMIDKPIIHNGEEVIPLIEVAKTCFKKLNQQEFCLLDGYVRLRGIFGDNRYTLHFDKKEVSFDARTRYKKSEGIWGEHIYVPNQFEGIQKLIELRFNVFGLEENEFIDASKVKCYE